MIFNRTLTATEIQQLYTNTYPLYKTQGYINTTLDTGINNTINLSLYAYANQYFKLGINNQSLIDVATNNATGHIITNKSNVDVKLWFFSNTSVSPLLYNSFDIISYNRNYTCADGGVDFRYYNESDCYGSTVVRSPMVYLSCETLGGVTISGLLILLVGVLTMLAFLLTGTVIFGDLQAGAILSISIGLVVMIGMYILSIVMNTICIL
jgi:hypothetical protein